MKIAFEALNIGTLRTTPPMVLVVCADTAPNGGDWDLDYLSVFLSEAGVSNLNRVVNQLLVAGYLDRTKPSSFHHLDCDSVVSDVTIIMAPEEEIETRATAASMGTLISSAVTKLLKQHDSVVVVNTASYGYPTSVPSAIRSIQDAAYDYKDSLKNEKAKIIYYHCHDLLPLTRAEVMDIKRHDSLVFTRDLVTAPPNYVTPQNLVETARGIASRQIKVKTLDPYKENMAGLTAVARGSSLDPEFIEMTYMGNPGGDIDYVFIGKGITFDSGGYSLKPAKSMETMKGDMAGAATVLGLFRYLAQHGSDFNIVGLIPTCENMIGKDAIVPGEIITYSNGKTVEVLNTDAEGRLILADALIYSQKFTDACVIDIATLTGGIVAGLGKFRTGLFTDDWDLKLMIEEAAQASADHVWHMPMDDESYKPKSEVADMPNITTGPSSITAAMFLREFAPKKWAHLDIAGTSGDAVGTGRPLPLITALL